MHRIRTELINATLIVTISTIVFGSASETAAQQITGTPGSPSATTTIDGKQLPAPDTKFGGVIKSGVLQSKAWWAPRIVPPQAGPQHPVDHDR